MNSTSNTAFVSSFPISCRKSLQSSYSAFTPNCKRVSCGVIHQHCRFPLANNPDSIHNVVQITASKVASLNPKLTSYEGNTWVLEIKGKRLFVDPWLKGSLTFGPKAFFEGLKPKLEGKSLEFYGKIDLILLSQGLPDHAHPETLRALDKNIPIIASPTAAKIATDLGFTNVTNLAHGKKTQVLDDLITIEALQGSLVGPPWSTRENAFLITENSSKFTVFYEPHDDVPVSTVAVLPSNIDVVVTSVVSQYIPALGNYPLVRGIDEAVDLCKRLRPKYIFPLLNFNTVGSGFLMNYLEGKGSLEEFGAALQQAKLGTKLLYPSFGQEFNLTKLD